MRRDGREKLSSVVAGKAETRACPDVPAVDRERRRQEWCRDPCGARAAAACLRDAGCLRSWSARSGAPGGAGSALAGQMARPRRVGLRSLNSAPGSSSFVDSTGPRCAMRRRGGSGSRDAVRHGNARIGRGSGRNLGSSPQLGLRRARSDAREAAPEAARCDILMAGDYDLCRAPARRRTGFGSIGTIGSD